MHILIVDDEKAICNLFEKNLVADGHTCCTAPCGETALKCAENESFDLAIIDQNLGGISGIETGKRLKSKSPDIQLIMITGRSSAELKQLSKANFFAYVEKPINDFVVIDNIIRSLSIPPGRDSKCKILGKSDLMVSAINAADRYASNEHTILILGETGTGKEVLARYIHSKSRRSDKNFVIVNCAGLPPNIIESELLGHVKGAFTSAIADRIGKFELAHGGTIFLDEIGEMPIELQSKLLRVLQERTLERVGGNKEISVDVRILAATNRNLSSMVKKGLFREDLFYRLSVIPITLPPLRKRGDDILLLANHLLKMEQNILKDKRRITFNNDARKALKDHTWPGNVRELENVIKRTYANIDSEDDNVSLDSKDIKFDSHDDSDVLIEINPNSSDIKMDYIESRSPSCQAAASNLSAINTVSVDPSNKMDTTINLDVPKKLELQDIADLMNKIQLQEELGASSQGDMILLENAYINLVRRIIGAAKDRRGGSLTGALSFLVGEDLGHRSFLASVIYERIESKLRLFAGLKTPVGGRKPRGTTGRKKKADSTS